MTSTSTDSGQEPSQEAADEAECAEPAELAQLSGLDGSIVGLDEVLAPSDADLEAFADGSGVGTLNLASFLAPGGGWAGSEAPARRAIPIGSRNGPVVTSLKRSSGSTGSDHHISQRRSFAVDVSNGIAPTPQMLRTARQIATAMGYSWPPTATCRPRPPRRATARS